MVVINLLTTKGQCQRSANDHWLGKFKERFPEVQTDIVQQRKAYINVTACIIRMTGEDEKIVCRSR